MFEKMFSDSGRKVKQFAKIVFIIFFVMMCVLVLISCFAGFVAFLEAVIVAALIMLWLYIFCLMITVTGEVAESVSATRRINSQILDELKKISSSSESQPMPLPVFKAEPTAEAKKESAEDEKEKAVQHISDTIRDTLAYALKFSTDEGIRGYIEIKRSQSSDAEEISVYNAILFNPNERLRTAVEAYLTEK